MRAAALRPTPRLCQQPLILFACGLCPARLDRNYLTGRTSNELMDVRAIEVVLVVETEALPRFINSLAQVNFMTITNLSIAPTSAFKAAEQGYVYGERPVSLVNMEIETLWFRKWTAAWMPMQVREAFGIKSSNAG